MNRRAVVYDISRHTWYSAGRTTAQIIFTGRVSSFRVQVDSGFMFTVDSRETKESIVDREVVDSRLNPGH